MKFHKTDSSIILLDLSMMFKDLEKICKRHGISFDTIKHNKVELGIRFLWIDLGSNIVAFTLNGSDEIIQPNTKTLLSIKVAQPVEPTPLILDTDTILDKISEHGMTSLTQEEKDFLSSL